MLGAAGAAGAAGGVVVAVGVVDKFDARGSVHPLPPPPTGVTIHTSNHTGLHRADKQLYWNMPGSVWYL
jgi:hypothetical protein